nr:MAG TPA: hypothetical protein [Caudoviricetes sp.]
MHAIPPPQHCFLPLLAQRGPLTLDYACIMRIVLICISFNNI